MTLVKPTYRSMSYDLTNLFSFHFLYRIFMLYIYSKVGLFCTSKNVHFAQKINEVDGVLKRNDI